MAFLSNASCKANDELGRDHVTLPVTHQQEGSELWFADGGTWFYYARGCSDFGWPVGRTMLVSNRYEAAVQLVHRRAAARGAPIPTRAQAARQVASILSAREPSFVTEVLQRARESRHHYMQLWRERFGPRPSNVTLDAIVLDAAGGVFDPIRCRMRGVVSSDGPCLRACASRTKALVFTLLHKMYVIDALNINLMRELCGTEWELDTVQLLHQHPVEHSRGLAYAMTELWDARNVCQRDRRPASSSSKAASLALKRLASLSRWANGSACEPSPIDEFARCSACNGSQMQSHCLATTQRNRTRALERKRPVRGSSIRHQVSTPRLH